MRMQPRQESSRELIARIVTPCPEIGWCLFAHSLDPEDPKTNPPTGVIWQAWDPASNRLRFTMVGLANLVDHDVHAERTVAFLT